MEWSEYVKRVVGDLEQAQVAQITGIPQSTISRWLNGKQNPSADLAVMFARMMPRANPVEALVITGVLWPQELNQAVEIQTSVDDLTNAELVELLARRLGIEQRRAGRRASA